MRKISALIVLIGFILAVLPAANALIGDADGSLSIGGQDYDAIAAILSGQSITCEPVADCSNLDLNGDSGFGVQDLNFIAEILSGQDVSNGISKPTEIEIINLTTDSFTVGIKNQHGIYMSGMEVSIAGEGVAVTPLSQDYNGLFYTTPYLNYNYVLDGTGSHKATITVAKQMPNIYTEIPGISREITLDTLETSNAADGQTNVIVESASYLDADGSLSIGGPDYDAIAAILSGQSITCEPVADCSNLDFDGNGAIGVQDLDGIGAILSGQNSSNGIARPAEIEIISMTDNNFTVGVKNQHGIYMSGIEVEIEVDGVEVTPAATWNSHAYTQHNITFFYTVNECGNHRATVRTVEQWLNAYTIIPSIEKDFVFNALDSDGDGFTCEADCNDNDAEINPNAGEVCDGADNNCDMQADEGVELTFYLDSDGDTFGNPSNSVQGCSLPADYVSDNSDCDDSDDEVNTAADEICGNGVDDNCDSHSESCYVPNSNSGSGGGRRHSRGGSVLIVPAEPATPAQPQENVPAEPATPAQPAAAEGETDASMAPVTGAAVEDAGSFDASKATGVLLWLAALALLTVMVNGYLKSRAHKEPLTAG